jgi:nuclear pore complex protein Nup155
MLLGLASGNTFLENDVALGVEPGVGTLNTLSPDIALVAKQAFYDFGERPMWAERVTYGTTSECRDCLSSSVDKSYSAKARCQGA